MSAEGKHTVTYSPQPIKKAIDISSCIVMSDGGWLDPSNHFDVTAPFIERGSREPTEKAIIDSKYKTVQFITYKNTLLYLHGKYKEKAYWKNIGITIDPYEYSSGLEGFREYARVALQMNEPSFAGFVNLKYNKLCVKNNLSPSDIF